MSELSPDPELTLQAEHLGLVEASPGVYVLPHLANHYRPAPSWYEAVLKLGAVATALLATFSLTTIILFIAPTSKSNADTAHQLAQGVALSREEQACAARFTADISISSAEVLKTFSESAAAVAESSASVAHLIAAVATMPRDQVLVNRIIADQDAIATRNDQASQHNADANARSESANKARDEWEKAGRPLPCPKTG